MTKYYYCIKKMETDNPSHETQSDTCKMLYNTLCRTLNICDTEIYVDSYGKPYGKNCYISFSHSFCYACVVISRYTQVGIDIQKFSNKLIYVKEKYINTNDNLCGNDLTTLCRYWCAKEATYKASKKHLYGLRDITVTSNAQHAIDKYNYKYKLDYMLTKSYCLSISSLLYTDV